MHHNSLTSRKRSYGCLDQTTDGNVAYENQVQQTQPNMEDIVQQLMRRMDTMEDHYQKKLADLETQVESVAKENQEPRGKCDELLTHDKGQPEIMCNELEDTSHSYLDGRLDKLDEGLGAIANDTRDVEEKCGDLEETCNDLADKNRDL